MRRGLALLIVVVAAVGSASGASGHRGRRAQTASPLDRTVPSLKGYCQVEVDINGKLGAGSFRACSPEARIVCGLGEAYCSAAYLYRSLVALNAQAANYLVRPSWTGCDTNFQTACQVHMTGSRVVNVAWS